MLKYTLYADGFNEKNPGLSSISVKVLGETGEVEGINYTKEVGYMTKDAAVVRAILEGLQAIASFYSIIDGVKVILKSKKLVRILQGKSTNKDKKLTELLNQVRRAGQDFGKVTFSTPEVPKPPKKKTLSFKTDIER
jgi:ribonuclease HI